MTDDADPDAPLFEPFAVQEIFLDGFFSDAHVEGEMFRCTAFSMQMLPGLQKSQAVAVVRLVIPTRAARLFMEMAELLLKPAGPSSRDRRKRG